MARKAEVVKHPAIARKLDQLVGDAESLEIPPGWETFTPIMRRYLEQLMFIGTKQGAREAIGKSQSWLTVAEANYPEFKALEERVIAMAGTFHNPAFGPSLAEHATRGLLEMVRGEKLDGTPLPYKVDHKATLNAYQYVLRLLGLAKDGDEFVRPTVKLNVQNVTMFQKPNEPPVVESQATVVG